MAQQTISVDLLQILLLYADHLGIEGQKVLAECGLNTSLPKNPDSRIPLEKFNSVWRAIYKKSGNPHFGLHFGEFCHSYLSRHLLYVMMMNCRDVEQAIHKNFQYHNLITDYIRPLKTGKAGLVTLSWEYSHPDYPQNRQLSETVLSLFVSMLNYLTENRIKLTLVRFSFEKPESLKEYERVFCAPFEFNSKKDSIVLNERYLEHPIVLSNPTVLKGLEEFIQKTLHRIYLEDSVAEKVANLLFSRVISSDPTSVRDVAKNLGMSERNLQIKLKNEGQTFRMIQDRVRREIAVDLLNSKHLSICDIASLLGFSDQSAFHHSFKRWTGQTPGDFRKSFRSKS